MPVTMESLKKAVNKKKGKSMVFAWLADLERAAGDLDSALKLVDGGLTLYPGDVAATIVRAKILFEKGEYETCVSQCEGTLRLDPFNLAAFKIMGDAYDMLGNVGKRNVCYRQYHDMDPLNKFWKEEYETMPEPEAAPATDDVEAAAAVAAGAELSDSQFSMDDDSLDFNLSEESEETSENGPAAETIEEASFEKAFGDAFGGITDDVEEESSSSLNDASPFEKSNDSFDDIELTPAEPKAEESENSLFEKSSASSGLFAGLDDEPAETPADSPFSSFADEAATQPAAESADAENVFGSIAADDDPFAALAAMLPNGDDADDSQVDDLAASLDSVMSTFGEESSKVEEFPVDDNISGNDVNSALSDIFGLEDDLEAETSTETANASPFSVDAVDEQAEANASEIFGSVSSAKSASAADEPTTVDNAFDSIFGEDELPEELPTTKPAVAEIEEPAALMDEPAAEPAPVEEDKPTTVDNAFDSIFGEDELPEELPAEKPAVAELEEPAAPIEEPAATDFVFGDISLDDSALDVPADKGSAEDSLTLDDSSLEIEGSSSLFEKSADSSFSLGDDKSDAPALASAMDFVMDDTPAVAEEKPASDQALSVDSAFESIFGDDDDLPEERPAEPVVEETADNVSLAEQVDMAEAELELPAETKSEGSDLAKEMGGAFASMFGDDDDLDLPGMNEGSAADQEATGAAVEESFAQMDSGEAVAAGDNLASDLDKSFDSLFGGDDLVAEAPAADAITTSPEFGTLENEVSGAFKGLFDMDDDSLEEQKPANSGVDFLMSGDSDDEVSAGLINNPDAPLNRGSHDLDDSLKTRTLAEIYFDQGLYEKALEIYRDLADKNPDNQEIASRMAEIKNLYDEKFGG